MRPREIKEDAKSMRERTALTDVELSSEEEEEEEEEKASFTLAKRWGFNCGKS